MSAGRPQVSAPRDRADSAKYYGLHRCNGFSAESSQCHRSPI